MSVRQWYDPYQGVSRLERELMVAQVLELVCDNLASFFGENVAEGDWFQARDTDNEVRFSELADVCRELHVAVVDSRWKNDPL